MKNLYQGSLAELKAVAWFISHNFAIYKSMFGWEPCDFIVEKDKLGLKRVSVKSTTQLNIHNSWECKINQTRVNINSINRVDFDSSFIDYLAVYLVPIDKLLIFDAKLIKVKTRLTIKSSDIPALEAFTG